MLSSTALARSVIAVLFPLALLAVPPASADDPLPNDCTEFSDFSDELTISNLQVTSQTAAPDDYVDLEIMADIANQDVGDFSLVLASPELAAAGLNVATDPPVTSMVFRDVLPNGSGTSQTPLRLRVKSGDVDALVAGLESGDIHLALRVKERPQLADGVNIQYWHPRDEIQFLTGYPSPLTFRDLNGDGSGPPPMVEALAAVGGKFYTAVDPSFLPDFLDKQLWSMKILSYDHALGPPYRYELLPDILELDGEDNPSVLLEAGSYCSGPDQFYDPVTHRNLPIYVEGEGPPENGFPPEDHIQPVHFNGVSFADGAVTVSGQMGVHAALPRTEVRIRPSRVKITTHLDIDVSMAAELEARRRIELSPEEKTVVAVCFSLPPIPAGPVTIPTALQLKHQVGASASFSGAAVVGFEKQVLAGMTIIYDSSLPPGQQFVTQQQSTSSPIEFSPPRFSRNVAAHARVSTDLTATLLVGPSATTCNGGGAYLQATGYGTFDAQLGDTPSWSLGHGEEITVGASLSFFGLDIASYEASAVDFPGHEVRTEPIAADDDPFSGNEVRWGVSIDDLDSSNSISTTTVRGTSDGGAAVVSYGDSNAANYLTRLDPFGSYLWHKKFKPGRTPSRLVVLPDDSMIVAGAINHTTEQWVAKLDPDGNVLWARDAAIGDPANATILGNCALKDIEPISNAGEVTGFIVAGDVLGNPTSSGDGCLVRLDAGGAVQWGKIYRQDDKQRFNAVTPTADGGFAVAGFTTAGPGILYEDNGLLARMDADGNLLWSQIVVEDKQRVGELHAIIQSADGTLYFSGRASGPIAAGGGMLVGRIDPDGGNPRLHLVHGTRDVAGNPAPEMTESYFDIGMDMALTPGGIAVVGTQGIQVNPSPAVGPDSVRAWAFEMDADLGVEWMSMFDGPWSDEFHSVARTGNGLLVAGVSQSFLPLGTGFEEKSLTVMHLPFEGVLRFLDGTNATSTYLGPAAGPVQSDLGSTSDSPMTVLDAVLRSTTPISGLLVAPPRFCVTALTAAGRDSPLDSCDQDTDNDGVEGLRDNCPDDPNADQADLDGDAAGDACDPPVCGNAVIEGSETCDDGNVSDGDGCESMCTPTALCNQVVSLTKGEIVVKKLGLPLGDELLEFSGTLAVPVGATLDPEVTGLQLLVDDPAGLAPILDLTERTTPVPPGAMGPSACDSNPDVRKKLKDGWMLNKTGAVFTYRNRTDALPAADCVAGSARGLRKIVVNDLRAEEGIVTFKMVAGPLVFGAPSGPLAGSILFGTGSLTGFCGKVDFNAGACTSNRKGTTLTCR